MIKANQDIRRKIVTNDLKYWQVANAYGVTDATFSKKLRLELPEEEKSKINSIIDELVKAN